MDNKKKAITLMENLTNVYERFSETNEFIDTNTMEKCQRGNVEVDRVWWLSLYNTKISYFVKMFVKSLQFVMLYYDKLQKKSCNNYVLFGYRFEILPKKVS